MKKEVFYNEIMEMMKDFYGDEANVSIHEVSKNNGIKKCGLCVTSALSNCGPTVYLDEFYEAYVNGTGLEEIKKDVIDIFEKHVVKDKVDVSFYEDFSKVKSQVCFKLVNAKRNMERLKNMPHRIMEDLAVVYFVSLEFMEVEGAITIKSEHMNLWNVTEEDLYEAAMDNTPRIFPADCVPMGKMLDQMMPEQEFPMEAFNSSLIVGTNTKKINGASIILYPGLLNEISEFFGNESYYILPSSVHELIFLKAGNGEDETGLQEIVKSVNETCVSTEDFLSDRVFYFDVDNVNSCINIQCLEPEIVNK